MTENKCTGCKHPEVDYNGIQFSYNHIFDGKHYFIAVTCRQCESFRHYEPYMYVKHIDHATVRDDIIDIQDKLKPSELEQLTMDLAELM
jgi:hypothetical protein